MNFVYVLQSLDHPDQFYTGLCADVGARLRAHNAGQSPHTSKYKPWKLISAHYFAEQKAAADFERYLKSGSGRASRESIYADRCIGAPWPPHQLHWRHFPTFGAAEPVFEQPGRAAFA